MLSAAPDWSIHPHRFRLDLAWARPASEFQEMIE
jgi:hypothetical protein